MSTESEVLYHPSNGSKEQTWTGFSWPAFFFGVLWLAVKNLWGHAVVMVLLCIISAGFMVPVIWIVYGFVGNGLHRDSLIKKGYLTPAQWGARNSSSRAGASAPAPSVTSAAAASIEAIRGLKELLDSGALSQEEFDQQKSRILAGN